MQDIAIIFDTDRLRGDFAVVDRRLLEEQGLTTAVLVSLFSDRRAEPADRLPDDGEGLRGWWGDLVDVTEGASLDPIGSKLWLLSREKQTTETLRRAEAYAREALAWMTEDGVARAVAVTATAPSLGVLQLDVVVARPNASPALRYGFIWSQERWRVATFQERVQ